MTISCREHISKVFSKYLFTHLFLFGQYKNLVCEHESKSEEAIKAAANSSSITYNY